ncbi:Nfx1-type zinc finger-containing protein [Aureococcus anophagefferens]|nr:Nfx1-type zinc finger-containing protein [Aureococcus anophagefferens]
MGVARPRANASRWKELCADGQEGVMCQVCSSSFHYDVLRNKCVECPGGAVVQGTPLAIFSCALAALLLALATYRCLYDHTDIIFTVAKDLMKDHEAGASDAVIKGLLFFGSRSHLYDPAAADFDPGGTSSDPGDDAGGVDAPVDPERISIDFSNAAREERDHADGGDVDEEPSCGALSDDEDEDVGQRTNMRRRPSRPDVQPIIMEDDSEDEEEEENEQILRIFGFEFNTRNRKSLLTKLKIVIGVFQIIDALPWSLPMVTLPEAFQTLIEWTSVLELNLVRVLPFDCFMRMDYYRTILIATMTPVFVGLCIFLVVGGRDALGDHRAGEATSREAEAQREDESISHLSFLFEEYEPRCYLFVVPDLFRKLCMTSLLVFIYPGSATQIATGLLIALISAKVYSYAAPYIEYSDDAVAELAQTQIVIIFFMCLMIFVTKKMEEQSGQPGDLFQGTVFSMVMVFFGICTVLLTVTAVTLELAGATPASPRHRPEATEEHDPPHLAEERRQGRGAVVTVGGVPLETKILLRALRMPKYASAICLESVLELSMGVRRASIMAPPDELEAPEGASEDEGSDAGQENAPGESGGEAVAESPEAVAEPADADAESPETVAESDQPSAMTSEAIVAEASPEAAADAVLADLAMAIEARPPRQEAQDVAPAQDPDGSRAAVVLEAPVLEPAGPKDPRYEKYERMLKMGVPAAAVDAKMRAEGLDPQDMHPKEPPKRAQGVALVLKKIRDLGLADGPVVASALAGSSSDLSFGEDTLELLRRVVLPPKAQDDAPKPRPWDAVANAAGRSLREQEAYVAAFVLGVPRLRSRFDVLLVKFTAPKALAAVGRAVRARLVAVEAIAASESLRHVLRVALLVGNALNHGSSRQAAGVGLSSLAKMSELSARHSLLRVVLRAVVDSDMAHAASGLVVELSDVLGAATARADAETEEGLARLDATWVSARGGRRRPAGCGGPRNLGGLALGAPPPTASALLGTPASDDIDAAGDDIDAVVAAMRARRAAAEGEDRPIPDSDDDDGWDD